MIRVIAFLLCCISFLATNAQDYSNRGLLEIKEQSEALRMDWIKAFDDAVQTKNFRALQPLRKENESYLDKHIIMIRRLYTEGDGRAMLSAVNNYLKIEDQFVKDAMIPAESITAGDQDGINKVYQKIEDFVQKEKLFLIDINNAMRTESMDAGGSTNAGAQLQQQEENSFDEPHGSVIEGRPNRKKGKLPHEQDEEDEGKDKRSKKKKRTDSDDDR